MSVIRFDEVGQSQAADVDEKNVKNYTRSWLIETNSKSDTIATAGDYAGLPAIGNAHPLNSAAKCQGLTVRYDEPTATGAFWTATAKYSTKTDPNNENEDPLSRPVRRSLRQNVFDEAVRVDGNGDVITNSAGDPPIELPTKKFARPVFVFVRNEATIPVDTVLEYQFKTNADTFYGAEPGTLLCSITCSELKTENDIEFCEVTYEFEWFKTSQKLSVEYLNIGYRTRTTDDRMIRVAGNEPRLLHAVSGNPNVVGHTVFTNEAENCVRPLYPSRSFSGLGL